MGSCWTGAVVWRVEVCLTFILILMKAYSKLVINWKLQRPALFLQNYPRPTAHKLKRHPMTYYARDRYDIFLNQCTIFQSLSSHCRGTIVQAPLAASAGIDPLAIQISIKGCKGSISLTERRPNSFATDMKCTKQEFRSVHPFEFVPLVMCQKGSTQ